MAFTSFATALATVGVAFYMFREGTLPENVITNQVISTDGFNVSAAWIGTPTVEVVGGRYYSVRATGEWGSLWAGGLTDAAGVQMDLGAATQSALTPASRDSESMVYKAVDTTVGYLATGVSAVQSVLAKGLVLPDAPFLSLVCCVGKECTAIGTNSLVKAPADGVLKCKSNSFVVHGILSPFMVQINWGSLQVKVKSNKQGLF